MRTYYNSYISDFKTLDFHVMCKVHVKTIKLRTIMELADMLTMFIYQVQKTCCFVNCWEFPKVASCMI